ncbi:hypothetical protein [Luteolibacter sp. Populi]|uniref:hypothetical protein n=1 Tax=Luteolibacter sp. Populi TaxID=3230487 RepID=UPI003466F317
MISFLLMPVFTWVAAALAICTAASHAAPPQGTWVNLAEDGRLLYTRDALGNRVPDFGDCGYMAGRTPIPEAPVKVTLKPADGDDRAAIQAAISQVAAMPMDANGIRGAVLLTAGEYQLGATLNLNASGVVLRGEGASDTGTRLRATAARQYTLVSISGSGSPKTIANSTRRITDKYVPVGSRSFLVDDSAGFAAGQSIVVYRPCTQAWIKALGMDRLEHPWTPGSRDIEMERVIVRIEGKRVFIDAPVTTAIDAKYGGGKIYRYTQDGRIRNSGIEGIKGISDYDTAVPNDENHGWIFIRIGNAEDCWARRIVAQHFGFACVSITAGGRRISVLDAQSLDPVSEAIGGRRYAFYIDGATQCLVANCHTKDDRHQYVTGSDTPGPNAFVSSSSDGALDDAGPHHRWGSGMLYDRITCNGDEINVRNRGNSGSGHGWAGANCVVWNSTAKAFIVQDPPTARNWLIGSIGKVAGNAGTFDANGANVFPATLWGNQRQDLQACPNLQVREYTAGDIDRFTADAGEITPVDGAWQRLIASQGSTAAFDTLQGGRWLPWTHDFALSPGDTILGATLWVSVRGLGADSQKGRIYFDDPANSKSLSQYAAAIPKGGATVLRIDLADQLARLGDGKLNLAMQGTVAADWSILELRVAPASPETSPVTLAPEAEAGTGAILAVKKDTDAGKDRRALLRWDVSAASGKVVHAKIRLTPIRVGAENLENCAAMVPAGAPFVSWWPRVNHTAEITVTSEVLAALARDGKLSLEISSTRESATVEYASVQHPDPAKRPQLLILTDRSSQPGATPFEPPALRKDPP